MSKKNKLSLEIIIDKIIVEDESYYSVKYTYTLNGKTKKGLYENDYEGWTIKQWKEQLEDGYALKCALEDIQQKYE